MADEDTDRRTPVTARRPDRVIEMSGSVSPSKAFQMNAGVAAGDSLAASRRARMRARAGDAGPAGEDLACPACRATYGFGDTCPSCDVRLVSESLVDAAPPEPARRRRWDPMLFVAAAIVLFALVAWATDTLG